VAISSNLGRPPHQPQKKTPTLRGRTFSRKKTPTLRGPDVFQKENADLEGPTFSGGEKDP
jgi:hypothetical protein